ncbi:MAG: efflux RND transporter periplasmic adaptor subunit [Gemmataceae bacterium]
MLVLFGVLALSGAAALYLGYIPGLKPGVSKPAASAQPPERNVIVALGRIEPAHDIIDIGATPGERLQKLLVMQGEDVKEGQALATLTSLPDREADRNVAAARLADAEKQLAATLVSAQSTVREAEVRLRQVEEVGPLEIKAQEAKVRLISAQLATAEKEMERIEGLKLDSIPQQQIDRQKLAVRQAREELTANQALLEKLKMAQPLQVDAAKAGLASAEAGVERVRAEVPVAALKAGLALADAQLAHSTIKAPSKGKVLDIMARPGETLGQRPILQLADTGQMVVTAEVYETDIQYVQIGARATIESKALPKPLEGTVERIGTLVSKNSLFALDPTAAADHRIIEVTVKLDDDKAAARFINLQVKVSIKK